MNARKADYPNPPEKGKWDIFGSTYDKFKDGLFESEKSIGNHLEPDIEHCLALLKEIRLLRKN
jgi:hypothetical protein